MSKLTESAAQEAFASTELSASTPETAASTASLSSTATQSHDSTSNDNGGINESKKNPFWKPRAPPILGPDGQPLSRNATKRLLKQQQFLERKPLLRQQEKLKRKQKNKERHDAIEAGLIAPPPKRHKSDQVQTGITIGIDMSFDDLMLEKEIKSMVDQIKRCYSYNRTSEKIVHLALTSFTGSSRDEFQKRANGYELWKNFTIHEDGLEKVWPSEEVPGKDHLEELKRLQVIASAKSEAVKAKALAAIAAKAAEGAASQVGASGSSVEATSSTPSLSNEQQQMPPTTPTLTSESTPTAAEIRIMEQERLAKEEQLATIPAVKKIVYLSADSPNTITQLESGTCYVLGGIVDKNRYPNLCQSKAEKLGVETAQLPIGEYIQMSSRRILTVNQVFEILLQFTECNDWKEAFLKVIPQRKLEEKPRVRRSADAWRGDPALRTTLVTGSTDSAKGSGSNSVASSVTGDGEHDDESEDESDGHQGHDLPEEGKDNGPA
ncbi:tRNA (guanine(9)-N(1))-methyltransferase [Dissophora globulifera]|nr:tRNA (guanine(9)-N(1))-methyltransferase [Dissophora globulifera]